MIILPDADDAPDALAEAAEAIVQAGRRMDEGRFVPATAGNLSVRLDDGRIAITRSGTHKGRLEPEDVIAVDAEGRALGDWGRPSVETPLHCQLYRLLPGCGAVLHGHSVAAAVLSRVQSGAALHLAENEMLKAFGVVSGAADLPIVENEQDVAVLVGALAPLLPLARLGYVIRGHGSYAWGPDLDTALVRYEALEFLLACELARRSLYGAGCASSP